VLDEPGAQALATADSNRRWHASLALRYERRGDRTVLAHRAHVGPLVVQKALYQEGPAVCHTIVVHPPAVSRAAMRLRSNSISMPDRTRSPRPRVLPSGTVSLARRSLHDDVARGDREAGPGSEMDPHDVRSALAV
jgi:hypothetical protein